MPPPTTPIKMAMEVASRNIVSGAPIRMPHTMRLHSSTKDTILCTFIGPPCPINGIAGLKGE
jgi:hypothetical protein